jgi:hypothetical protein
MPMKQKYGSPIVVLPRKPNKGWLKRLHVVGDAGRDVRDVIFQTNSTEFTGTIRASL